MCGPIAYAPKHTCTCRPSDLLMVHAVQTLSVNMAVWHDKCISRSPQLHQCVWWDVKPCSINSSAKFSGKLSAYMRVYTVSFHFEVGANIGKIVILTINAIILLCLWVSDCRRLEHS